MDASSQCLSSLVCEVSIIRAKNFEFKSSGDWFVRCCLPTGNNTRRVQLNSKKISSESDLFWDEFFSLECLGTEDAINSLRQGSIVFELRSIKSVLERLTGGSKIMGRAEIPLENVFESPNIEVETWARMNSKNPRLHQDVKPPSVPVEVKIGVPEMTNEWSQNNDRLRRRRWDYSCGCKEGGCQSLDYDLFALGFALEAL
ncbi:uncharacterized protein [Coffea arabica]|uniref:C2 domain-containing protein n=1 Tax=Coffea arabica TaxID=13443 RepID=A0ABM4V314_COFAR